MPYGNRKGPEGLGPKTGRGLGLCSGSDTPGYTKSTARRGQGLGKGLGRNRGMGRGLGFHHENLGNRAFAHHNDIVEDQNISEKELLENDIKNLEENLKLAKERLKTIKNNK